MSSISDRRRTEVRALAELGLTEIAGASDGIHDVHRAISDRVFAAVRLGVGVAAAPVKAVHDGITDGVYATISTVLGVAAKIAAVGADWRSGRPPSETPRGAVLIGAVLGLIGDQLEEQGSVLAADPVTVRVDGAIVHLDGDPVPAERLTVSEVFDGAGGRLVVLLHGLTETEYAWTGFGETQAADDYGVRLAVDLGMTPVYLRYNSGRHISATGRDVAELLERLVAQWPAEVTEIVLIGHSMGGLVARSAAHQAQQAALRWPELVRGTVSLGTPHLGAPLEQAAHYGSAALAALPETSPFARLLRRRSDGIRDLRGGSLVDEDWTGLDADALGRAVAAEVALLPGASHFFVAATVTHDARHPLGRLVGDGLVLPPSAAGRGKLRRIGFRDESGMHLGRAHHFTLLRSDEVYRQLLTWLTSAVGESTPSQP
jgi:pimeloyl-ACP methyl ester carboxylesterase